MPKNHPHTKKKQTQTTMSGFGGTERVSHNSVDFYARKVFSHIDIDQTEHENDIGKYRNKVICRDSTNLHDIPDSSIHLMITSPPYNVGKDYNKDMDMKQYMSMLDGVFADTYRLLVNGGRVCINI